jgi:mannose-6-phosphate isomerase-like protein (cupin superfamily)
MLHERYAPGADTGPQMLRHDAEESRVILTGRLEITVGHRLTVRGPGDACYFDSRVPHRFRNAGDEECMVVSANSPPSF